MGYTPPLFNVRKITAPSTGYSIYPDGVTTDDLYIYANPIDVRPVIIMYGASGIDFDVPATLAVTIKDAGTQWITFRKGSTVTDAEVWSRVTNNDIYLRCEGTGVVKFGTHTGSGDVACNGSILIKDAAGNARKLMTTA